MYLGVKHKVKMVHIGSIDIYHPNILLLKKVIIFLMMLFFPASKKYTLPYDILSSLGSRVTFD